MSRHCRIYQGVKNSFFHFFFNFIDEIDSLTTDEIILLHSYFDHRQKFCTQLQEQAGKLKQKEEVILKFTSEVAMALTCEIAEFQNVPRKIFIQNRKKTMNEGAIANETLAHLVVRNGFGGGVQNMKKFLDQMNFVSFCPKNCEDSFEQFIIFFKFLNFLNEISRKILKNQ